MSTRRRGRGSETLLGGVGKTRGNKAAEKQSKLGYHPLTCHLEFSECPWTAPRLPSCLRSIFICILFATVPTLNSGYCLPETPSTFSSRAAHVAAASVPTSQWASCSDSDVHFRDYFRAIACVAMCQLTFPSRQIPFSRTSARKQIHSGVTPEMVCGAGTAIWAGTGRYAHSCTASIQRLETFFFKFLLARKYV